MENSKPDKKKHAIKDLQGVFTVSQSEAVIKYVDSSMENLAKESDIAALRALLGDILQVQLRSEHRFETLEAAVENLAVAQYNTEERIKELAEAQRQTDQSIKELAAAQKRTEERVEELAAAQKRTEERVDRLELAVQELAAAQKRTEERIDRLELAVQELAAAQKRTEERVEELAAAQKRTEERLDRVEIALQELAAAQKRTDERMEELAAAQKRTEERLDALWEAHIRLEKAVEVLANNVKELRVAVGSLAQTIGFSLEEFVADLLPPYLEYYYQIKVDKFEKYYLDVKEFPDEEIDLYGEGTIRDNPVDILVECQTSIGGGGVKELANKFSRVEEMLSQKVIKIIVAMNVHPSSYPIGEKYQILILPYGRLMRGEKSERSFYQFY